MAGDELLYEVNATIMIRRTMAVTVPSPRQRSQAAGTVKGDLHAGSVGAGESTTTRHAGHVRR